MPGTRLAVEVAQRSRRYCRLLLLLYPLPTDARWRGPLAAISFGLPIAMKFLPIVLLATLLEARFVFATAR